MDEAILRQLVREVLARHLPETASDPSTGAPPVRHPSHHRFSLAPSPDGACIVEPAVRCTHCGFCQTLGH